MDRKSFVLYTESREIISKLSVEQRGLLLMALFDHADGMEPQNLDPLTDIVYTTIRNYMDRDFEKYEKRCQKNRDNANNRWNKTDETMQSHTNASERMQSHTDGKGKTKSDKKRKTDFNAPSLDEVRLYIESKGYSVDAKNFFDYYEANEWRDKDGNKVKSWKQKVITWNGRNNTKIADHKKETGARISAEQRKNYVGFAELFE